jgi:hypothetical protein
VSLIPAAKLPPVSLIVDTGGKFATGVVDTREFSKKFENALMIYSGAWGQLIHEKNQKQKIS